MVYAILAVYSIREKSQGGCYEVGQQDPKHGADQGVNPTANPKETSLAQVGKVRG